VRKLSLPIVVLGAALALQPVASAQSLTFSLFGRYLDSLREQAGIPGMSALISENGVTVWEGYFGRQSLESTIPPTPDTSYLIGGLSQTFGATLLLKECFDEHYAELSDRVTRWQPTYPEPATTLYDLLTHLAPTGVFRYDPARFAGLTAVIEECSSMRYRVLLADAIFNRFGMTNSVPGHALIAPTEDDGERFSAPALQRYADVVRNMAVPYRIDSRGRATRSEVRPAPADAASGIVTTARDLARFDSALGSGAIISAPAVQASWTQGNNGQTLIPSGLGWFVQNYKNQPIVWQYGIVDGAYSSLVLKAPSRGITLILLANSDGLNAPFALENGDITTSLFAQLALRLLVP
jgi:CubicO group peptidase (beta-lactamase class C family)